MYYNKQITEVKAYLNFNIRIQEFQNKSICLIRIQKFYRYNLVLTFI